MIYPVLHKTMALWCKFGALSIPIPEHTGLGTSNVIPARAGKPRYLHELSILLWRRQPWGALRQHKCKPARDCRGSGSAYQEVYPCLHSCTRENAATNHKESLPEIFGSLWKTSSISSVLVGNFVAIKKWMRHIHFAQNQARSSEGLLTLLLLSGPSTPSAVPVNQQLKVFQGLPHK